MFPLRLRLQLWDWLSRVYRYSVLAVISFEVRLSVFVALGDHLIFCAPTLQKWALTKKLRRLLLISVMAKLATAVEVGNGIAVAILAQVQTINVLTDYLDLGFVYLEARLD